MAPERRTFLKSGVAGVVCAPLLSDTASATGPDDEWPMSQYDARNSGQGKMRGPSGVIEKEWEIGGLSSPERIGRDIHNYIGTAPAPIISDNYVFARGNLYDARDGSGIWSLEKESARAALYDDMIILGDHRLRAVDIDDGSKVWEIDNNTYHYNLPIIHDGYIYVTSVGTSWNLLKLNAEDGTIAAEDDNILNKYYFGVPTVDEEGVFCYYDARSWYELRKLSHDLEMEDSYRLDNEVFDIGHLSYPTIVQDQLYIRQSPATRSFSANRLVSLDKATLTERWKYESDDSVRGKISNYNNLILVIIGNSVVAFDRNNGDKEWEVEIFEGSPSDTVSLAVGEELGFVGGPEGMIYAVDLESGELEWEHSLDTERNLDTPAISDGSLFVISSERNNNDQLVSLTDQPNDAPTADFTYTPSSPTVDESVEFDADPSSDDNGIEEYEWEFPRGGRATGVEATHTFISSGEYDVTLTVTDIGGLTDSKTETIRVAQPAEVPDASFSFTPSEPTRGDEITFDAAGSTSPDGAITGYHWEIGGEKKRGQQVTHTFEEAGEYSVTLEVTDDTDLSDSTQQIVEIEGEQLSVSMRGDQTSVPVGEEAIVNLSFVNFLTNSELSVQLILQMPSGISVSGVSGADEGSGQLTAVTEVAPGSETNMLIRLRVNEPGEFPVTGRVVYIADDGSEGEQELETVTISATEGATDDGAGESSDDGPADEAGTEPTPGDGDSDGLVTAEDAAGFGLGTALTALGGVSYLLKRRLSDDENET